MSASANNLDLAQASRIAHTETAIEQEKTPHVLVLACLHHPCLGVSYSACVMYVHEQAQATLLAYKHFYGTLEMCAAACNT